MKKEKMCKIFVLISAILFCISTYLFIVTSLKDNQMNDSKKFECNKEILSNGLMTLSSKYDIVVLDNGSIESIREEQVYYFPVEAKYHETIKESSTFAEFECDDTYDKDKKITCVQNKNVLSDDNQRVWYVPYIESLTETGYVCE